MNSPSVESVKAVSQRLLCCLGGVVAVLLGLFVVLLSTDKVVTLPVILLFGALGAFMSLQRRLKHLSEEDLMLFRESLSYTLLAPLAGAILAGVLYLMFIAQLLSGPLFPEIRTDTKDVEKVIGLAKLFFTEASPVDYAKILVWSFVAGFSERFVTDIIGRFSDRSAGEI